MARTPEGKVKDAIKAWLKARRIWFFMPVPTGMGVAGIPDFICCWRGKFLGIEAKAPGKRKNTSDAQDARIKEIHEAGGAVLVVDDVSQLDELEKRYADEA
jgi:hypothetical protein